MEEDKSETKNKTHTKSNDGDDDKVEAKEEERASQSEGGGKVNINVNVNVENAGKTNSKTKDKGKEDTDKEEKESKQKEPPTLDEILKSAGLDTTFWKPILSKYGITSGQALGYLDNESFKQIISEAKFPWETNALKSLKNSYKVVAVNDYHKKQMLENQQRQKEAESLMKDIAKLRSQNKSENESMIKEKANEVRKKLGMPDDQWIQAESNISFEQVIDNLNKCVGEHGEGLSKADAILNPSAIVEKASGGLMLRGLLLSKNIEDVIKPRKKLINTPENVQMNSPVMTATTQVFDMSSKQQSDNVKRSIDNSGLSVAGSIAGSGYGLAAEVGFATYHSTELQVDSSESTSEMFSSRITCDVLPTVSLDLQSGSLELTNEALKELSDIERLGESYGHVDNVQTACENFFTKYGSHVNVGIVHLGGIYKWICTFHSETKSSKKTIKSLVQNANSAYASMSYSGFGASAGVSVSAEQMSVKGNFTGSFDKSDMSETTLFIENQGGPADSGSLYQWKSAVISDSSTWAVIDRGDMEQKDFVGVWDLIRRQPQLFDDGTKLAKLMLEAWEQMVGISVKDPEGFLSSADDLKSSVEQIIAKQEQKNPDMSDQTYMEALKSLAKQKQKFEEGAGSAQPWLHLLSVSRMLREFLLQATQAKTDIASIKAYIKQLIQHVDFDECAELLPISEWINPDNPQTSFLTEIHREEITKCAKALAHEHQGQTDESSLDFNDRFEKMFSDWALKPTDLPRPKLESVRSRVVKCLLQQFQADKGLLLKYLGNKNDENPDHGILLNLPRLEGSFTVVDVELTQLSMKSVFDKGKCKLGYFRNQIKQKVVASTRRIFSKVEEFLERLSSEDSNFEEQHVVKMVQLVRGAIEEENNINNFTFKSPYTIMITVQICRHAVAKFEEIEEQYEKTGGWEKRVQEYKQLALQLFRDTYVEEKGMVEAADFFFQRLKKDITEAIRDDSSKKVIDKVLNHFNRNKYRVILDIMEHLAKKGQFESYELYIGNSYTFASNWMQNFTKKTFFDSKEDNESMYMKMVKESLQPMMSCVTEGVKYAKSSAEIYKGEKPVQYWVEKFKEKVPSEWNVSPHLLQRQKTDTSFVDESFSDISNFSRHLLDRMGDLQKDITEEFKHENQASSDCAQSPHEIIMEKLWGCKEQCPLCNEPCSENKANHTDDISHSCFQHRPQIVGAVVSATDNDSFTQQMISDPRKYNYDRQVSTCNEFLAILGKVQPLVLLVDNWAKFNCYQCRLKCREGKCQEPLDKGPYDHLYRDYKNFLPLWDIESKPRKDTLKYWMWFVITYSSQVKDKLGWKHDMTSYVPDSWSKITKEEALLSLEEARK